MRKFEHIASLALRNDQVKDAVTHLFDQLRDMRIRTPGASISRPAAMVTGGRQKSKRTYTCGYCHEKGHNKTTCPVRRRDEEQANADQGPEHGSSEREEEMESVMDDDPLDPEEAELLSHFIKIEL